ncbi:hypothetical protein HanPSC8_Chr10g0405131 [Helianthus annuus]|nr:hypothetical protein HanPSC8_Chr10g0405131 [Helianthus annuus]
MLTPRLLKMVISCLLMGCYAITLGNGVTKLQVQQEETFRCRCFYNA